MQRTIFITSEEPRLDYSPAYAWGDKLVAVFPPGQVQLSPEKAVAQARSVLSAMKGEDCLLLSGDPVKIAICAQVVAESLGYVRMLRFNRHDFKYVLVVADFRDVERIDEGRMSPPYILPNPFKKGN